MRPGPSLVLLAVIVVATTSVILPLPVSAQMAMLPESEFERTVLRPPQSMVKPLEVLIGSNDFEPVGSFLGSNRYRKAGQPVGRLMLLIQTPQGRAAGVCTASIVSSKYILTNHHCIPGHGGTILKARLDMGYYSTTDLSTVRQFSVHISPSETDAGLDYSLVEVDGNPSQYYGTVELSNKSVKRGESLFVIQHPAGDPQTLSRRDCFVRHLPANDPEFTHSCDTLGGSSGSPVFRDDGHPTVVGLHFAGSLTGAGNFAKRMDTVVGQSRILRSLVSSGGARAGGDSAGSGVQTSQRNRSAASVTRRSSEHVVFRTFEDRDDPYLNLRSKATYRSDLIAKLPDGTGVELLGRDGAYHRVRVRSGPNQGKRGYAHECCVRPAGALDLYFARLGPEDHTDAGGERLQDVAAIILRDRVNYHRGRKDRGDGDDVLFHQESQRRKLEGLLKASRFSKHVTTSIRKGEPRVRVVVWPDSVEISIVSR